MTLILFLVSAYFYNCMIPDLDYSEFVQNALENYDVQIFFDTHGISEEDAQAILIGIAIQQPSLDYTRLKHFKEENQEVLRQLTKILRPLDESHLFFGQEQPETETPTDITDSTETSESTDSTKSSDRESLDGKVYAGISPVRKTKRSLDKVLADLKKSIRSYAIQDTSSLPEQEFVEPKACVSKKTETKTKKFHPKLSKGLSGKSTVDSLESYDLTIQEIIKKPAEKVTIMGYPGREKFIDFDWSKGNALADYNELLETWKYTYDVSPCAEGNDCWALSFYKINSDAEFMVHGLWAQDIAKKVYRKPRRDAYFKFIFKVLTLSIPRSDELKELISLWFTPTPRCTTLEDFQKTSTESTVAGWLHEYFKHYDSSELRKKAPQNFRTKRAFFKILQILALSAIEVKSSEEVINHFLDTFFEKFPSYVMHTKKALMTVKGKINLTDYCKNFEKNADCAVCLTADLGKVMDCATKSREVL